MTRAVVENAIDQGVHRFLVDGVHCRDLMDIRARWRVGCVAESRLGETAVPKISPIPSAREGSCMRHRGKPGRSCRI